MAETNPPNDVAGALKAALRSLIRPVAVVTAEQDGSRFAMAATAFCEVSMNPPSMLVCINRNNATFAAVRDGTAFGLCLLADDQEEVSRRCGGGASQEAKFEVGDWLVEEGKPPRLADSCAALVLKPVRIIDHGTHAVVIGEVVEVQYQAKLTPLAFHNGGYVTPLAEIALQIVAQSRRLDAVDGMTGPNLMMDLMRAFYWFDEGLQSALKSQGWQSLSRNQSIMFASITLGIRKEDDLARHLGTTQGAVSEMMQELSRQGLIDIRASAEDGSLRSARFSEKSRQLRKDALAILGQLERHLGSKIGAEPLHQMRLALSKDWGAPPLVSLQHSHETART